MFGPASTSSGSIVQLVGTWPRFGSSQISRSRRWVLKDRTRSLRCTASRPSPAVRATSSLVVRSGGQSFALPQSALVELVDIPQREFARVVQRIGSAELYRLRERLLPMVWLDRLLGLEPDHPDASQGHYLAVLEADGCRYGLVVDDLMSPEEIVVKPLSPVLREIGMFSGATVLGNGTLALILDVGATAARAGVKHRRPVALLPC